MDREQFFLLFFCQMKSQTMSSTFTSAKWQTKPKLHRYPTKRWGHTAVINKNKLYIYGGKTGKVKEPLYELDCDTFECHILESHGLPDSRESHSCSLIKERLIIWGGCRSEKVKNKFNSFPGMRPLKKNQRLTQTLNDCINFTVKERVCFWSQIAQFPLIKTRESHATVVLKDKYILMYGGSDDEQIYDDFWVFNSELEIWFEIKNVVDKMKKRLGCTINVIGDTIYMFGGEGENQNYENELYTLNFEKLEFNSPEKIPQLACELVRSNSERPPQRSCHSAVSYLDRYLIIIGGEGYGNEKGKPTSILLNDVWCYDTQQNVWREVDAANRPAFKPRSCFTANVYLNKIYIFGGLTSTESFRSSDELIVLSLTEKVEKNFDFCNICKLHYRAIELEKKKEETIEVSVQRQFKFGIKNLYRLARTIKNPFDAIALLVEAFNRMEYTSLNIDLIEGNLLMIQGMGVSIGENQFSQILSGYDFVDQIKSDDPRVLEALEEQRKKIDLSIFSSNLKNACARIGQTFIFINRRSSLIDLMLVDSENVFYSEVDVEDYSVGKKQKHSFQIITNYMIRNNLNISLIKNETFTIAVTDLRSISMEQSEMKIGSSNSIEIAGINKKISLNNFLSTYFLKIPLLQVFINAKKVEYKNLYSSLVDLRYESLKPHDFINVCIRQVEKIERDAQKQIPTISIYKNGVRVGNYTKREVPYIEGFIELPFHYELSPLRYKVENMKVIEHMLIEIIKEFLSANRKRQAPCSVNELELSAL